MLIYYTFKKFKELKANTKEKCEKYFLIYNWFCDSVLQTLLEQCRNNDLVTLYSYYHKNRLHLSLEKTSYTLFHLNTHETSRRLKIGLKKSTISYSETPRYLGVTLDRSLTYKQHLLFLRQKAASRCALLSKHVGTTWGTFPHTLRTSALALVYSTAEYCTPVWSCSAHTKLLDTSTTVLSSQSRGTSSQLRLPYYLC